MIPRIHLEAERLVRERKAVNYSAACRMIAAQTEAFNYAHS